MKTTLIIKDEVNCQFTDLSPECRRKMVTELEYFVPGAQYSPAVKLGRWNGKQSFCDVAGRTYINLIDRLLPIVYKYGYEVEIDDRRQSTHTFEFEEVNQDSYSHMSWPVGHVRAGLPILLREHQVEIINGYLNNMAGVAISPTGSGKCVDFNTTIDIEIDETTDFGKFMINKLQLQEPGCDITGNSYIYPKK